MRTLNLGRSLTIILFGVGALVAAIAVGRDAAGNALARTNPALALRIAPDNPDALARTLDLKLARATTVDDGGRIKRALHAAPLTAPLIRLLAFTPGENRSLAKVRRLMALSERTTRRDVPTQFWMIEDAVQHNDIPRVLRHYDIALATEHEAQTILFPVLIQSLSEPKVRANLSPYLRRDRPWVEMFLTQAIAEGTPAAVGQLFTDLGPVSQSQEFRAARAGLIGAFVVHKDYVGLHQYTATLWPGARAAIQRFAINSQTTNPSLRPLTWELMDSDDIRANLAGNGGVLISASNGARGIAARRIVLLSPGNWKLSHGVKADSDGPVPDVSWEAYCLGANGQRLAWQQSLPRGNSRFEGEMNIPTDCQATEFRIIAGAGLDEAAELAITMSELSLQQIR